MIDCIRECHRIYESLRREFSQLRVEQVQSNALRERVRSTVDGYFRTDRPLLSGYYDPSAFDELNKLMRDLLSLSQRRSLRSRYIKVLKSIVAAFNKLELSLLPQTNDRVGVRMTAATEALLGRLEQVCPVAARCYRQGVSDLDDSHRTSWRGTATEFREALRELLDSLASDQDVESSPGYKLESGARRPTMRQKARYILGARKARTNSIDAIASLADTVDERFGGFVRNVYSCSSGSVHCDQGKAEVSALKRYVDLALADLIGSSHDDVAA